jgi:hypothetical protein
MAASPPRSSRHRQVNLVAKFNTSEVPEHEIKAQLQSAEHTQREVRARSLWSPKTDRTYDHDLWLSASTEKVTHPSQCSERSSSVDTLRDTDSHTLNRAASFNSLSTLQRTEEAARLSQYRDSPVSICNTDRTQLEHTEESPSWPPSNPPAQHPRRSNATEPQKTANKAKTSQKKPKRSTPTASNDGETGSEDTASPRRAVSDPSFRRPKSIASQLMKRLTSKPGKLAHRPKTSPAEVPHIDDFDCKAQLQQYFNSNTLPETVVESRSSSIPEPSIAELPGSIPLPAYTPYQASTTHYGDTGLQLDSPAVPLQRATSITPPGPCCEPVPRMMRCDSCQFGIKHADLYLLCLYCNHGDRIICEACDAAGNSCRHQLIRKRRNFLQEVDSVDGNSSGYATPRVDHRGESRRAFRDRMRGSDPASTTSAELEPHAPSTKKYEAERKALESKDLELRRKAQELEHREREASLREREGLLRLREAEVAMKTKEAESKSNTDFMRSCMEMAMSLGAQFANVSRATSTSSTASTSPVEPRQPDFRDDPYVVGASQGPTFSGFDANHTYRSHGGSKRKADGDASSGPSRSGSNNQGTPPSRQWKDTSDGDRDDAPAGTPKKQKQEGSAESKLYACPYCKYDHARYSDRNNHEKHYRSCSAGYWPDISRLKQHLYRVHWRGRCCESCFTVFKTDEELDLHRQIKCSPRDCPFPEKFGPEIHTEIKKKRPAQSSEEVWYLIFEILFPGAPRPTTPFADRSEEPEAPSPSTFSQEGNRQMLERLFEARLNDLQQDRLDADTRAVVRDLLRDSLADMARQLGSSTNSTHQPTSGRGKPPRLSIPQTGSSLASGSQPVSATSTYSNSSAKWHRLPNHRRSFSRPLPSRSCMSAKPVPESALTSAVESTPPDHVFNIPTPADVENDTWGNGADSWREGDECGLAITTDAFEFPFSDRNEHAAFDVNGNGDSAGAFSTTIAAPTAFRPVNINSLADHSDVVIPTQLKAKMPSDASTDSGYGSLRSRERTVPTPGIVGGAVLSSKSSGDAWEMAVDGYGSGGANLNAASSSLYFGHVADVCHGASTNAFAGADLPVPDHEINYDALDEPFHEFTAGRAWDLGQLL